MIFIETRNRINLSGPFKRIVFPLFRTTYHFLEYHVMKRLISALSVSRIQSIQAKILCACCNTRFSRQEKTWSWLTVINGQTDIILP